MQTKSLVILALIFSIVFTANADPKKGHGRGRGRDPKLFVAISAGVGLPLGNFAKADTAKGSGFASLGAHLNLTAGYKFIPNVGVMIMVGETFNSFNAQGFLDKYAMTGVTTTITGTSYYTGQYLAGPIFCLPTDKVDINARILVGAISLTFPVITEQATDGGFTSQGVINTPSAMGFAYDAGVGAKIKLSSMIGIMVNADYFGSSVSYTNQTTVSSGSFAGGTNVDTKTYTQSVGLINITAGFSLSF